MNCGKGISPSSGRDEPLWYPQWAFQIQRNAHSAWFPSAVARRRRKNKGSSFNDWLREDGIHDEVTGDIKRLLAQQREQAMKEKELFKAEVERRMHTSRAVLDRFPNPWNSSATLNALYNAATVPLVQARCSRITAAARCEQKKLFRLS